MEEEFEIGIKRNLNAMTYMFSSIIFFAIVAGIIIYALVKKYKRRQQFDKRRMAAAEVNVNQTAPVNMGVPQEDLLIQQQQLYIQQPEMEMQHQPMVMIVDPAYPNQGIQSAPQIVPQYDPMYGNQQMQPAPAAPPQMYAAPGPGANP